ncbi:MAG: CBS domain-containing protein [Polyangiaceae bacterium]|nr:CBS domain-containing protein [Polyangiaceae bacterium]
MRAFATEGPLTVSPDDPPHEVARRLDEQGVSAALVVDAEGRPCGVVSTTDLLRALPSLAEEGAPAPAQTVRELMSSPVVSVGPDATLGEAAALMLRHRIHRVVVDEGGGQAPSVLTTRGLMRAVLRARLDMPLGTIMSEPVETVDVGDSIADALRRLERANVHGLVVVDGAWPVGVFTHTEALRTRHLPPTFLSTPVEQVMSYETICLDVKTPLYRVAGYVVQMNVRRVLAVENRALRGVASGFDLARVVAGEAVGERTPGFSR